MNNLYHVYYKMPALRREDMYVGLENLTKKFVESGLLRIDAEPMQNFVRFSIPTRNLHIVFSKRELYEEHLIEGTYNQIRNALIEDGATKNLKQRVEIEVDKLKNQLKKHLEVSQTLEMELARILIQSAHPVVFLLIMQEKVQVFLSYGDNIGEVMDIVSWQRAGSNSGMQSTDGKNVVVFVSCGGDPLALVPIINEEQEGNIAKNMTYGDGEPALARMMGIAGQELGHYSDIKRDQFSRQYGRYSANFSGTKANPIVNNARLTDLKNINYYYQLLQERGLQKLIDIEKNLQIFDGQSYKDIFYYIKFLWMKTYRMIFSYRAKKIKFQPLKMLEKNRYLGVSINEIFGDMAFNLAPVADVYKNSNPNIEIAIACIEALARVPQQANKWGHNTTLFFWRNLYKFYYNKVIPGCIKDYETISGKKFTLYPSKLRRYSFTEKLCFKYNEFKAKFKQKV
jgi:hypothetical protein